MLAPFALDGYEDGTTQPQFQLSVSLGRQSSVLYRDKEASAINRVVDIPLKIVVYPCNIAYSSQTVYLAPYPAKIQIYISKRTHKILNYKKRNDISFLIFQCRA